MASYMRVKGSPNFVWFIDQVLGKGAMGCVYIGRHRRSGHKFAIKVPNLENRDKYKHQQRRELQLLKNMEEHENIIRLVAIEKETYSKDEIIVMELCSGGSLQTILEKPVNFYGLEEEEFMIVFSNITAGLNHLWLHGIVHRDIKPGNILLFVALNGRHIYKLTDFGAAKDVSQDEEFYSLFGTEEYLDPNMHRAALEGDDATEGFNSSVDLWSVGVTLYQCATGKLPFRPFKGVRKDRRMMQKLMKEKQHGVISRVELEDGQIMERTDLPATCPLSRGARHKLMEILPNVLEYEEKDRWKCAPFFEVVRGFSARVPVRVFEAHRAEHLVIYMEQKETVSHLKEAIAEQTGIRAADQSLFLCHHPLEDTLDPLTSAGEFPETSEEEPILLVPSLSYIKAVGIATSDTDTLLPEPQETTDGTVSQDLTWAREASGLIHRVERQTRRQWRTQQLLSDTLRCLVLKLQTICAGCKLLLRSADKSLVELTRLVDSWTAEKKATVKATFMSSEKRQTLDLKIDRIRTYLKKLHNELKAIRQKFEELSKTLEKARREKCKLSGCRRIDRCCEKAAICSLETHKIWAMFKEDKRVQLQHNEMEIHKFHRSELKKLQKTSVEFYQSHCVLHLNSVRAAAVECLLSDLLPLFAAFQQFEADVQKHEEGREKLVKHIPELIKHFSKDMVQKPGSKRPASDRDTASNVDSAVGTSSRGSGGDDSATRDTASNVDSAIGSSSRASGVDSSATKGSGWSKDSGFDTASGQSRGVAEGGARPRTKQDGCRTLEPPKEESASMSNESLGALFLSDDLVREETTPAEDALGLPQADSVDCMKRDSGSLSLPGSRDSLQTLAPGSGTSLSTHPELGSRESHRPVLLGHLTSAAGTPSLVLDSFSATSTYEESGLDFTEAH